MNKSHKIGTFSAKTKSPQIWIENANLYLKYLDLKFRNTVRSHQVIVMETKSQAGKITTKKKKRRIRQC